MLLLLAALAALVVIAGPVVALVLIDRRTRREPGFDWEQEG